MFRAFCNPRQIAAIRIVRLIKIRVAHDWTILFGKSTVQTFVTLDTSTRYTNKSETILQTKPFIAFLNRSSGIKRGQPHNAYNIIITDTKQRQPLCFFCVVVQPFRAQVPTLSMKRPQSHRYTFMFNK